jgi:hypothetical protein
VSGRVSLDDFNEIPARAVPTEWDGDLAQLLEDARSFFRRYVVVDTLQGDTVALWTAHSYVFDCARATPYLYFWSPEYGSGKTTALEVLEVVSRDGLTVDDLSGAALFRLIEARHPTLLLDELDGVFGKKGSESAEDHRKLLNSGYRAGKRVFRCGGKEQHRASGLRRLLPEGARGSERDSRHARPPLDPDCDETRRGGMSSTRTSTRRKPKRPRATCAAASNFGPKQPKVTSAIHA